MQPESATAPARKELTGWRKLLVDFGPLIIFFVGWNRFDIFVATAAFMAATAVAMAMAWLLTRHIPAMLWFSGILIAVMGGLTLWLQDDLFIKMKPTLVFLVFSGILTFGLLRGRNYVQAIMGRAMPGVSPEGWRILAVRAAIFFAILAGLNEFFWRFTTEATWVHFKVWGDSLLTFLFVLAQFPMLKRHGLQLEDGPRKSE
jgi:intracellular septation protein